MKIHGKDLKTLPLYVVETGLAHSQEKYGPPQPRPDNLKRGDFLRNWFKLIITLIGEKIPLQMFNYWCLCDNYEWFSYTPRFGLFGYDYKNHMILDTDGFGYPAGKIFRELIESIKSNDSEKIKDVLDKNDS